MTNEELNTKLYEKLFAEQQDFKGWLVKQPPEEILKHAYEYVIREDIVIEVSPLGLPMLAAWTIGQIQRFRYFVQDAIYG